MAYFVTDCLDFGRKCVIFVLVALSRFFETPLKLRLLLFYIISALLPYAALAQNDNVSGVINSYARVLDIDSCENTLFVSTNKGFSQGDRILIIQMQGAIVDIANSPAFGTVTSYRNAGNYEYATIGNVSGLYFTLTNKLLRSYTISDKVQIVRVPQYNDVTVTGTVIPLAWNGSIGGIVVFDAKGKCTLQADIDASGAGFRGGDSSSNNATPGLTDYGYQDTTGNAGLKGESVAQYVYKYEAGRGANANGGGGGNSQNAGGGGGSNFGSGGLGGDQADIVVRIPNGGLGGHPLDLTDKTKTYLGGGGGGGHSNDSRGRPGASGGGLIIINTNSINSAGGILRSNGANGRTASDSKGGDGAGGGGSGGTVLLGATSVNGALSVEIIGGKGGDNDPPPIPAWCFAPGGGGGGGIAWIPSSATTINVNAKGGNAGLVLNNALPCFNTTYGADSGRFGGVRFDPIFHESKIPYVRPNVLFTDAKICEGDSVILGVKGGVSFTWSPATGLDAINIPAPKAKPTKTTTYVVEITTIEGCKFLESVNVIVNPHPKPIISGLTDVCGNSIAGYKIPLEPGNTYQWIARNGQIITGQGSDSLTVLWDNTILGAVILKMTPDSSGCTGIDSLPVFITPTRKVTVTGVRPLCFGDSITLVAEPGYAGYKWSTNDTTPTIKIGLPGSYYVDVFGGKCILRSDSFSVLALPTPRPNIKKNLDTIVSPCDVASLTAAPGFTGYRWSTGDTSQSIATRDSGWFYVSVVDTAGCIGFDSAYIGKRDNGPTKFIIALDTLDGNTGDHVYYPLKLISTVNGIQNCEGDYTATVHFNRTMLVPDPPFISSRLLPRDRYVTFGGSLKLSGGNSNELPGISFMATLGDAAETPIVIDSFTWQGFQIEYEAHDGLFRTRNICYQGDGGRFTDSTGLANLIVPRPNPASGIVTIDYGTIEIGRTRVYITDLTGTTIALLADGEHTVGKHSVKFNADRYANGRYFITLQTPTLVFHQALQIDH